MTTLFVAANGGHLAQLVELAPRFGDLARDAVWVTPRDAQSDALLDGAVRIDVPPVAERDVPAVVALNRLAARVFRTYRPDAVISTGSGMALGFLPQAAARGIPTYFVDSATFVDSPSVTGRVLERVPRVTLMTQHPHRAAGRWHYGGSVLDGFVRGERADRGPIRRAVVTLGSDRWSFRPMVERVQRLLDDSVDVLWQVGPTEVASLGIEAHRYVPADRLSAAMAAADVVIAHAGCGAALAALKVGRLPVLVPRDPARREVIDGHQFAFARALDALGLAVARTVDELTYDDLLRASTATVAARGALLPMQTDGGRARAARVAHARPGQR